MTYSAFEREAAMDTVVAGLSKGTPLTVLCAGEGMPGLRTIYDWMEADEQLSARIARAREEGFDAIASECLMIADDGTNDYVKKRRGDGSEYDAFNKEHVERSKLRVETRLKLLAKWDPKRYGERLALAGDKDAPLNITVASDDAAL